MSLGFREPGRPRLSHVVVPCSVSPSKVSIPFKALEAQSKAANRKRTNVPITMTSGWHIFRAVLEDVDDSFEMERTSWTEQGVRPELAMEPQIDADTQNIMVPTTVEALRSERISEEEFETRLTDRRITTSNGRRRFRRYTELANLCNIRQARGNFTKAEKNEFAIEWARVMATVFARPDGQLQQRWI